MEEPETDAVSAAVERVLSAHLAKQQDVLLERLDSRMEALERQVAEENAKTIKLVTARFNEVTGLVQGSKASASPVAVQTSSTSSGSEADLQAIPSKITHLDDRLTMVFTSLKRVESKLEQNQAKLSAIENKAVTETFIEEKVESLPTLLGTAEIRELAPKICQLQTNLDVLLTGESEANALIDKLLPAVSRLQDDVGNLGKRFDKGGSSVRGSITKGQPKEDNSTENMDDDRLDKIKDLLEDCREISESTKSYVKETLDVSEDILDKVKRAPPPPPHGGSAGPYNRHGSSDRIYKYDDEDEGEADSSGGGRKVVRLDPDMKVQMITVHQKLDKCRRELMEVTEDKLLTNVYAMRKQLGDFLKAFPPGGGGPPPMMHGGPPPPPPGRYHRGGPPPPHGGWGGRYPPRGYHRGGGHYHGGDGRNDFYRYTERGGRYIPGTKWTYDEQGKRIEKSDDEEEEREIRRRRSSRPSGSRSRSRSPRSRSRSRSRSSSRDSRSRSRSRSKESHHHHRGGRSSHSRRGGHRSDDSDAEGEIQAMERQIGKIAEGVREVQRKVDECLDYSQRAVAKSDSNTKILSDTKILSESMESRLSEVVDDVATIRGFVKRMAASKQKGEEEEEDEVELSRGHARLVRRMEEVVNSKLCEFGSLVETEGLNQSQRMQALTKEMNALNESVQQHQGAGGGAGLAKADEVLRALKGVRKQVDAYGSTSLQMAKLQKEIQVSVSELLTPDGIADALRPVIEDVQSRLMPVLEEVKKCQQQQQSSPGGGGKKSADPRSGTPASLSDETRLIQVFNALSELKNMMNVKDADVKNHISSKNLEVKQLLTQRDQEIKELLSTKDQTTAKQVGEIKGEIKNKFAEVLKNQKYSSKAYQGVEEIKKTLAGDSKLLAQVNSNLQSGLKDSKQSSSSVRDLVDQNRAFLEAVREEQAEAAKSTSSVRETAEQNRDSLETITKSQGEAAKSLASLGHIIGTMEKKILEELIDMQTSLGMPKPASSKPERSTPSPSPGGRTSRGGRGTTPVGKSSRHASQSSDGGGGGNAGGELKEIKELILKELKDVTDYYGSVQLALEENLCLNLEQRVRAVQQEALTQTFEKFDVMEARLAVIRKYAKHGTQECLEEIKKINSAEVGASKDPPKIVISGEDLPALISAELRSIGLPRAEDLCRLEESISGVGKGVEVLDEQAKKLEDRMTTQQHVLEEQFEALTDTVVEEMVKKFPALASAPSAASPGEGKFLSLTAMGMSPSSLSRMDERLKECLQGIRELCSKGGGGGGSKSLENINTLVELLHRVEKTQTEGTTRSIEYQTRLNEVFTKVLSTLEAVHLALQEDKDVAGKAMPDLCKQLRTRIAALSNLEKDLTRQQSCGDLPKVVQQCVKYLDTLLKDGSLLDSSRGGEGESGAPSVTSPDGGIHNIYQQIVSATGTSPQDDGGKTEDDEEAPRAGSSGAGRRKGRLRKKPGTAAEESSSEVETGEETLPASKRRRVKYELEEEEEEDDDGEGVVEVGNEEEEEEEEEEEVAAPACPTPMAALGLDEEEQAELIRMQKVRVKVPLITKKWSSGMRVAAPDGGGEGEGSGGGEGASTSSPSLGLRNRNRKGGGAQMSVKQKIKKSSK